MNVSEDLEAIVYAAEEGGYVAFDPATGTTTQAETVEAAIANLREAVELYLEIEGGSAK